MEFAEILHFFNLDYNIFTIINPDITSINNLLLHFYGVFVSEKILENKSKSVYRSLSSLFQFFNQAFTKTLFNFKKL